MSEIPHTPAALKYRTRRRVWLIFLVLVIVLFFLQLAAAGRLFVVTVARGIEEFGGLPLTGQDREVLIRIEDLVSDSAKTNETLRKWRGPHGTVRVRSRGHARQERGPVRLHCEVQVEHDARGAQQTYHGLELNEEPYLFIDPKKRLVLTAQSDLFRWGDESVLMTLSDDREPAGIIFRARRGEVVFELAVSGRKLDDPRLLESLLRPVLLKLEHYER